MMKHQQSRVDTSTNKKSRVDKYERFAWKVGNFSRLKNTTKLCTEPFVLCGYPWRISLFPHVNLMLGCLSIYLEAVETVNMSKEWSRDVKFRLVVFNQFDNKMTITKDAHHEFNEKANGWGYKSFMPLAVFSDPQKGFLVKDTCIIGVEVSACEARNEKQLSQAASLTASQTSEGQTRHTAVEVPKLEPESQGPNLETVSPVPTEVSINPTKQTDVELIAGSIKPEPESQGPNLETVSPVPTEVSINPTKQTDVELFAGSIGELVDFRGLGQIEKAFVPLLEEVCSQHPSLIECQQKRSRKYTGWAFDALGRVLYFLKTKKVKDMNEVCCKDLQTLWEELETFGFDLTWLEPHVQTTLGMKSYLEKMMQVEKLKENVVALELETEKIKAKLIAAKVILELETKKLDVATDLLKAKGFQVNNLDAELGYGS